MRKDMSKVIVERPRLGRGAAKLRRGRTRVVLDDDGEPLRAGRGGRAPERVKPIKTKALNENLAPLRRFLEAQVNRPWSKVFSEISANLKPSSTVQQHVRDHVSDFVADKTRMRGGEVVVVNRWGGETTLDKAYQRLYVHPRTGLLRKNDKRKSWNRLWRERRMREEAERAQRMRVIDDKTQLHCFDGVWWEVKLAKVKQHRRMIDGRMQIVLEPFADQVRAARLSALPLHDLYGRGDVYACAKRVLSKAEKKRHGLG